MDFQPLEEFIHGKTQERMFRGVRTDNVKRIEILGDAYCVAVVFATGGDDVPTDPADTGRIPLADVLSVVVAVVFMFGVTPRVVQMWGEFSDSAAESPDISIILDPAIRYLPHPDLGVHSVGRYDTAWWDISKGAFV